MCLTSNDSSAMKTKELSPALTPEATLQQITTVSQPAMELLTSIGLNVSGHYDKTLRQVCTERKWSEVEVLDWIKKHDQSEKKAPEPALKNTSDKSISELCDLLVHENHSFFTNAVSVIEDNYSRISKVHGSQYLWLKEAEWHVHLLVDKLSLYLKFEYRKFFPLAKQLQVKQEQILDGDVQSLKRSVKLIKEDHDRLMDIMHSIRTIKGSLQFDESACSSFRILCKQLNDLFECLDNHIRIEKHELLPKIRLQLRSL